MNTTTAKPTRGRPALVTENPIAPFVPFLAGTLSAHRGDSTGRYGWFDDIVSGSIATAVGSSNGTFNVSPSKILAAMYGPTISTAEVVSEIVSERAAQRIAKAARHAIHGVDSYLARHPDVKAALIADIEAEANAWKAPAKTLAPVPDHIEAMRKAGDYLAYGRALREFRLNS